MKAIRLFLLLTIIVLVVTAMTAQDRGGQRGPAPPPLTMSTTAYPDGGQIPAKYTQAGDQTSPALRWTNVPAGTVSFVLHIQGHIVGKAVYMGLFRRPQ